MNDELKYYPDWKKHRLSLDIGFRMAKKAKICVVVGKGYERQYISIKIKDLIPTRGW